MFARRFLQFCKKLSKSTKDAVRDTFEKVKDIVKTTTGKNLTELGLLHSTPANDLSPADVSSVDV